MNSSSNLGNAVKTFSSKFDQIHAGEQSLLSIRDDFIKKIEDTTLTCSKLKKNNPLANAGNQVEQRIKESISQWANDWKEGEATRKFSESFGDKVILLVFGKVNAGKSSLCNYLASLFPEDERQFFCLEGGKKRDMPTGFVEGVTETTAQIQGVELGGKLILLDSPGLHSVTDKNEDLTKSFTDSADAVLWLTPSTSPGQVDELKELSVELKSNKPLLPVITRSDVYEEDCDEDKLTRILKNKSANGRQGQENYVLEGAHHMFAQKKFTGELREPISISVHAYKQSDESDTELAASGLSTLQTSLVQLIDEAARYKPSKARQQVINYLNRSVLLKIDNTLTPAISEYKQSIYNAEKDSINRRAKTERAIKKELNDKILDWAEELKETKNREALSLRIKTAIQVRLESELRQSFVSFTDNVNSVLEQINDSDIGNFEDIEIEYEQVSGKAWQATAASGGAIGGSIVGGMIGGPLGAAIGGTIGGLLGNTGGSYLIETEMVTSTIGVDSSKLVKSTLERLYAKLPEVILKAFSLWDETLAVMQTGASELSEEVRLFKQRLAEANGEV